MITELGDNLIRGTRLALAHSVLLVLFILSVMHWPVELLNTTKPAFLLMGLYYWAIYRPTLIPPLIVFAIGLITDMVQGVPVGLNAFIFVLVFWIVRNQRRYLMGQSFPVVWSGFAIVAVSEETLRWTFQTLFESAWPDIIPFVSSGILSIVLFPLISLVLIAVHRALPGASSTR